MGYYTDYDFSANREEVVEAISSICGYSSVCCGTLNGVTWYDHDKHMKEVSKMFPDEVIVLEGSGEDQGDMWKAYYKNGKSDYAMLS